MIKNIEINEILILGDQIPVREGTVVSQTLARQPGFEVCLYSFGQGESITQQVAYGDVFYYVIGGKAQFGPVFQEGEAGQALLVPHGTSHSVKAKEGLQILYIQVFKGEDTMYINNFVQNQVVELDQQVSWEKGKIVSKTLVQREEMTMTLFAFDAGEGVSTHASSGDALVIVLDGKAEITVDGVTKTAEKGQAVIMPAKIPHAVQAITPYKMLLIVVKEEK